MDITRRIFPRGYSHVDMTERIFLGGYIREDIPRRIFRTIKNTFGNNTKNHRILNISLELSIKLEFIISSESWPKYLYVHISTVDSLFW